MNAPQWRDAPDQPGLWLNADERGVARLIELYTTDGVWSLHSSYVDGTRYFGPIPPDPQQEQSNAR